jgi:hypothetical protein
VAARWSWLLSGWAPTRADSGSDAGLVFGGVTLGIGIVALSTAGILTVMHEYEEEQVRVRAAVGPVGAGLELRF